MIHFLLIFFLFVFPLIAQNAIEKKIQSLDATSILPPDAAQDYAKSEPEALQDRIKDLEDKVERLEKLIEILRESSVRNEQTPFASLSLEPKHVSSEKSDPVADFEKIKQCAVNKDPGIAGVVDSFKAAYADHPLVPKAHFFLADYFYSQKEYEKAISLIKEGLVKYKGSAEEGHAIWILSLTLSEINKTNDACIALKKLLSLPKISIDLKDNATKQFQLLNCK